MSMPLPSSQELKSTPEIYDKSFGLFGRFAEVADKQKSFILNTKLGGELAAEQIAEIEAAWPSIIGFIQTIVSSSISSSAGLRAFDGQGFSEQTLPALFKYSNDLAAISKEENPFGSLEFEQIENYRKRRYRRRNRDNFYKWRCGDRRFH
jgi:hypothetical protein